ncbi:hypothetical protein ROE7235_03556 [Roseibaca ekhonensis]|uniref:Exonuclease domain-containing protein n=1 Tax=Roseinatronobacter ekhonensis TaxID=254356 RepID=A0A3B0MD43_9RHOB|nr:hypothetical protein ROE7235_03556 [Roseibaca ekhonensis]
MLRFLTRRTAACDDFPSGRFRFAAIYVETANNDHASICQIGVACVLLDNSIETWTTYVDPCTSTWAFTGLHGIDASTVRGAPKFAQALSILEVPLGEITVYQHSGFDRSAFRAACTALRRDEPIWDWQNSVTVARRTWPELKGNDGHGLSSLKKHLRLMREPVKRLFSLLQAPSRSKTNGLQRADRCEVTKKNKVVTR